MGVTDHSSKDELLGGLKHARHKRGIVYVDGKGKKLE